MNVYFCCSHVMVVFAVYVFRVIYQLHQVSDKLQSLVAITIGLKLGCSGWRECVGQTRIVTIFNRILRDLIYITET